MVDAWARKLPDGQMGYYTSNFAPGNGGVITARKENSVIVHTKSVHAPMSREQVEAEFEGDL